jgi:hypothetical protein
MKTSYTQILALRGKRVSQSLTTDVGTRQPSHALIYLNLWNRSYIILTTMPSIINYTDYIKIISQNMNRRFENS